MKKLLYSILLFPLLVMAQDQGKNYVLTTTYNAATTDGSPTDPTPKKVNITYLDGLGRPIQQVAVKASGDEKNIVTHIEYDANGRQSKQYLPYASTANGLLYESDPLSKTENFYLTPKYENTENPYSLSFYDGSPLDRVVKQASPGEAWKGSMIDDNDHTVKMVYDLNKAYEVRRFGVLLTHNATEGYAEPKLTYNNWYAANQLYKTIVKDENWVVADGVNKTTEEFKNKLGQLIL